MTDPVFQESKVEDAPLPKWFREAPSWFQESCMAPKTDHFLKVNSCRIHYARWVASERSSSGRNNVGVLFVHGGSAHAHWWDFIAPYFVAQGCSCVAVDLSGHGESGHRDQYHSSDFVEEVFAVINHAGLPPNPFLVGHSLGGWVALQCSKAGQGGTLGGIVVVDSPVYRKGEYPAGQPPWAPVAKTYDYLTIVRRFRLVPPQNLSRDFVKKYIAHHSVRHISDGKWTWKTDMARPSKSSSGKLKQELMEGTLLENILCPMAFLYGADSALVNRKMVEHLESEFARCRPGGYDFTTLLEIPDAGHHLILDEPQMFAVAVFSILSEWLRAQRSRL